MRLHEEYILRYGLQVPIIQYDRHSVVLLHSKIRPVCGRLLILEWHPGDNHPGYYEFHYQTPVHDSLGRSIFKSCLRTSPVYWDQYELKLLSLLSEIREAFVVVPEREDVLAVWQMFLYVCDSFFAKKMEQDFFTLVEHSLSSEFDLEHRMHCFNIALDLVRHRYSPAFEVWKYEIMPLAETHSRWLEKLINE